MKRRQGATSRSGGVLVSCASGSLEAHFQRREKTRFRPAVASTMVDFNWGPLPRSAQDIVAMLVSERPHGRLSLLPIARSSKMVQAALLLLMLEAANADLVSPSALKRSTPNLQPSTSRLADYPIFGSLADITARSRHVRFTPDSGHSSVQVGCPKSATSGHRRVAAL